MMTNTTTTHYTLDNTTGYSQADLDTLNAVLGEMLLKHFGLTEEPAEGFESLDSDLYQNICEGVLGGGPAYQAEARALRVAHLVRDAMAALGETGNIRVTQAGGLYVQPEENCDWGYYGADDARELVAEIITYGEPWADMQITGD